MSDPGASHNTERSRRSGRLWRTALAIVLTPVFGGAILGAGIALFAFGPDGALRTLLAGAAFGAIAGTAIGILLIGTFGLLFYWAAQRRGWTRWWHYMLGGAIGGILGLASLAFYEVLSSSATSLTPNGWIAVFLFAAGGTIVAGFAWLIRRPDRDSL